MLNTLLKSYGPSWYTSSRQKSSIDPKGGKLAKSVFGHLCHIYISIRQLPGKPRQCDDAGRSIGHARRDRRYCCTDWAHCRPGRVHHRYWPYDGCAQGYVSPSYYYYHRRGRSSGPSHSNGTFHNNISKSGGSMGGHGGGHK